MAHVFISYERSDRPHAERVATVLEQHGLSVWWDRKILAGETFDETIQSALNEARCVVVLWSDASVTSAWVKDEAAEGARRDILVPVRIDEVEIPLGFRQIHAVTLLDPAAERDPSRFDELVTAVDSVRRRAVHATVPSHAASESVEPIGRLPSPPADAASSHERDARSLSATVPRSYLYATLALVAILAVVAVWQRLGAGGSEAGVVTPVDRTTTGRPPEPVAAAPLQVMPAVTGPGARSTSPVPPPAGDATSQPSPGAAGVVVKGQGQDLYYVFDATGAKQLAYARTDAPINLFPGNYVLVLHDVRRPIQVAGGRRTSVETVKFSVQGTGADLYYLKDTTGRTQLAYARTSSALEIFPGDYTVVLHDVPLPVSVHAGRDMAVAAGSLVVPGSGSGLYYVRDATGEKQLAHRTTNKEIELLPGSYVIELSGSRRAVQVAAGRKTVVDR